MSEPPDDDPLAGLRDEVLKAVDDTLTNVDFLSIVLEDAVASAPAEPTEPPDPGWLRRWLHRQIAFQVEHRAKAIERRQDWADNLPALRRIDHPEHRDRLVALHEQRIAFESDTIGHCDRMIDLCEQQLRDLLDGTK